jgi:hypothetical protein
MSFRSSLCCGISSHHNIVKSDIKTESLQIRKHVSVLGHSQELVCFELKPRQAQIPPSLLHFRAECPTKPHEKQNRGSFSYWTSYQSLLCLRWEKTVTPRTRGSVIFTSTRTLKNHPSIFHWCLHPHRQNYQY